MAYTANKNYLSIEYTDDSLSSRTRNIQCVPTLLITDPLVGRLDNVSKSALKEYTLHLNQRDNAIVPAGDSEVQDTLRLYFELENGDGAHFDIIDPDDSLFLATTGAGENILKDKAVLDAAAADTPENDLALIIDAILGGTFYVSGRETPVLFIEGKRLK